MNNDHWNATGKNALDARGKELLDAGKLEKAAAMLDADLTIDAIKSATNSELIKARETLNHWHWIVSDHLNHRSGGSGQ